ncbi:unnamed protein product, partial [Symbiodinium sp. KB8]
VLGFPGLWLVNTVDHQVHFRFNELQQYHNRGDLGDSVFVGFASDLADDEVGADAEDLRNHLVARLSGPFDDYPLAVLSVPRGEDDRELVPAVLVAETSEGGIIAALPASTWHRTAARRVLPRELVRKVLAARVLLVSPEDRSTPLGEAVRVWLAILTERGEASVDLVRDFEEDVSFSHTFGGSEAPDLVPSAASAVEAASALYEFQTGESGLPVADNPASASPLESRVAELESCLTGLRDDMKILLERGKAPPPPPPPAPSRATTTPTAVGLGTRGRQKFEGLDPGVVQAALSAGVEQAHLEEMAKMVKSQRGLRDQPLQGLRPRATKVIASPLDDEDEDDDDPPGEPAASASQDPVHQAIGQLTSIASQLALQKKKDSSLEALLDGGAAGSADSSTSSGTGSRRNAAALRLLKERLLTKPREVSQVLERNLEADFALRSVCPSGTIRFLWAAAGAADALREGRAEECYARLLLLIAQGDQMSIDRGSWLLAAEASLEDAPPFAAFNNHTLPSPTEPPFTKLLDVRWIELFLSRLRDIETYQEQRRKLGSVGAAPQRTDSEVVPDDAKDDKPPHKPPKGGGAFKSGWSDTAYDSEENALQKTVNLAVLLLNWLALGRPKHVEDLESLIASLTLRGDAVAARSRGYSVGGRKEPLFDPIEVEFAGAAGRNAGATTPAKPIVASRLKFGSPPSFCPKRFMDAETLDHYEHPFSYAIAEESLTEDPPKARVLAQHPEKLALFRKLDEGGRLRLVPASVTRKKCLNGMFAVPKNLTADRLILDARGPNLLEPGRTAWTQSLGTISAVLGISLKDDEILLMSGADLSDYYYHYVISEAKLFSCYCKELENKGTSEGAVRLRKMSAKYKETGLVQNMKKGFEEVTEASFWGGKVNGVAGTVRPLPERTLPVLSLTVDVIRCGYATKHLLATLAGFYISAFQFRRRFMSLLEEIFLAPSWMEDHCTFRIWPALEAELWCLVIATPMVRTNLRADYLNQISATDASDSFEAEVSTEVSAEFVEEVHRHSLRKSVWTRLLHPLSAQSREAGELPEDEELPGDERLEEHPLWGHVFRCLPFRTVWRKKIRRKRHINLHELRAVLISEERRALRHPHCKLVTGADSQVSLGALLKGRSSSSKLNGALRQSLPAYIGLDIHGGYLYVRSCDNPADDPTRSVPTRTPPSSMPRWLHDAVDGNFELLDDELVKCGMDPVSLL